MKNKNKYYKEIDGIWVHRSLIKCIINPILRKLQYTSKEPYVIASKTIWIEDKPQFLGYTFTKVGWNDK